MKFKEVIVQTMAGEHTWWQAAGILGVTARTMRCWRRRYEQFGVCGEHDLNAAATARGGREHARWAS